MGAYALITIVVIVLLFLFSAIKVLNEYERAVVFRLGRVLSAPKGPGLIIIIPVVDRFIRISLRTVVQDVPPQDVITRDNVTVKVNAVVYFRVIDPMKSVIEVENYLYATSQLSQTTLRSVCGQAELDELLANREEISSHIQELLDRQTDPWGIKVSAVELKHIDLPEEMQRAMAKQAEAERERRSKIIHAEGEYQASQKLRDAADVIAGQPVALQLRYLQTLREISAEGSINTLIPLPMEIIEPLMTKGGKKEGS
ncbi:MAG: slipin family protein [Desulfomonilia bacterium]|jgi:regulator of protease activity HflC (stomatin/prohibitin superfamily)|uniref:Band 7 domain-containing protein n=1 Tax=anaerobic digester metagenome TaxID=1263854 RepID=A0A485M5Y4_9ZZZZ|nr:slipin family protein [Pseudomonadota bacterium]HON38960.1 slipin family protein [Deltaproteobacteria bacterium]HRS55975.1 slipin family protein [Desulfomonilia bacterium]HPD22148.1 slipin family protein [Deltaproteobacteria bacterium]HPX17862.1 slipin family protein [Deltaproteobacteria bacterium]